MQYKTKLSQRRSSQRWRKTHTESVQTYLKQWRARNPIKTKWYNRRAYLLRKGLIEQVKKGSTHKTVFETFTKDIELALHAGIPQGRIAEFFGMPIDLFRKYLKEARKDGVVSR